MSFSNDQNIKEKLSKVPLTRQLDHLFLLSNGSHLSFAHPKDKGNQKKWYRSKVVPTWAVASFKAKESRFRLGLWSSGSTLHVVSADFDQVPLGFGSYDRLFQYLQATLGHLGIVSRSVSGKVKMFFVVDIPSNVGMSSEIALDTLSKILPDDLFDFIDKSEAALSLTFLTKGLIEDLKGLKDVDPIPCVLDSIGNEDAKGGYYYSGNAKHKFKPYTGEIGQMLKEEAKLLSVQKEAVFRILLNINALRKDGFCLSSVKIGRECSVSHRTVRFWFTRWTDTGVLICINKQYNFRGATTYKGATIAAKKYKFNDNIKLPPLQKQPLKALEPLPTSILDEQWREALWQAARCFVSRPDAEIAFLAWVQTLPNWNAKGKRRPSLAKNAIRSRLKCYGAWVWKNSTE
jgi:hypothetical protein